MTKKRFAIKLGIMSVIVLLWYNFVYMAQINRLMLLDVELMEISNKVNMASNAKTNLENIKKRFEEEQNQLEKEKAKFVKRENLGQVTARLQNLAKEYNLKLVDFSPGFKDYFEQKDKKIIPLPLTITLIGQYLAIGKYIEHWQELPFYILPQAIIMERLDENGYDVQAVIETKLYTWNE
ncbi:type 4a pilus biogenesis protein PilO [Calditrichota bacterium GD2]